MQPTTTTPLPVEELVYYAALLAGLGPCARDVATEQAALLNRSEERRVGKECRL